MERASVPPSWLQATLAGLDLNLLLTLDALLEIRSVTATAERFAVTQSAVSHRLARIREFFDDPLLVSAGDDLVLTPKAEALRTPLRLALQELRDAVLPKLDFEPAQAERTFAIAAADLAEIGLLPRLLEHLSRVAPGVRVRMNGRRFVTGEALAEGKVDFAIAPGEGSVPGVGLEDTRGIRQRKLTDDGFIVMARRGHPRIRRTLTLEAYLREGHVLVAPQGSPGGLVDSVLARQGLQRRIVAQVASFLSAPFLVAGTDHLLTSPMSLADAAAVPLDLCTWNPPITLPTTRLFLYWHERMHHDPGHRWFRDEVLSLTSTA